MRKYIVYALLAILCFSTNSPAVKLVSKEIGSMEIMFFSSVIGAVFLTAVCIKKNVIRSSLQYSKKDWAVMAFLGAVGTFLTSSLLFYGVKVMKAQDANIINYLWPVIAILFGCLILHEKFTARKGIAATVSFLGVVLVATQGRFDGIGGGSAAGILSCVGAATCYGLFCALNKKYSYNSYISMAVYFWVSTVLSGVSLAAGGGFSSFRAGIAAGMIYIGIVPMALGYLFLAEAFALGDTARVSTMAFVTPFAALVLCHFILGETVTAASLAGLIAIIGGIFIQMTEKEVGTSSISKESDEEAAA